MGRTDGWHEGCLVRRHGGVIVRSGSVWLGLVAAALLVVLLCTGGWSPLALVGVAGSLLAKVKLGAWLGVTCLSLCAGPLLLGWLFVKGPPAKGESLASSVALGIAGIALTAAALFELPMLAAVLSLMFLGV